MHVDALVMIVTGEDDCWLDGIEDGGGKFFLEQVLILEATSLVNITTCATRIVAAGSTRRPEEGYM